MKCGLKTILVRCLYNHCQNRGICYVDLLRNITQCVCPLGKIAYFILFLVQFIDLNIFFQGFAGNRCQYPIDGCQSSPCPKHSHCIDLPNSYTCVCGERIILKIRRRKKKENQPVLSILNI